MLATDRLHIRPFTASKADTEFVLALLNTPGWLEFIGDRGIRTFEQAEKYNQERFLSKYGTTEFIMYAIDRKEDGATIGMCGLVQREYLDQPDIGYALLPEFSGKGYAVEAAKAIADYATQKLLYKKLYAIVTPHNTRSKSILEKLGFKFLEQRSEDNGPIDVFERQK